MIKFLFPMNYFKNPYFSVAIMEQQGEEESHNALTTFSYSLSTWDGFYNGKKREARAGLLVQQEYTANPLWNHGYNNTTK